MNVDELATLPGHRSCREIGRGTSLEFRHQGEGKSLLFLRVIPATIGHKMKTLGHTRESSGLIHISQTRFERSLMSIRVTNSRSLYRRQCLRRSFLQIGFMSDGLLIHTQLAHSLVVHTGLVTSCSRLMESSPAGGDATALTASVGHTVLPVITTIICTSEPSNDQTRWVDQVRVALDVVEHDK